MRGTLICAWCGSGFTAPHTRGPIPTYCSPAHRQAAYRDRHHDTVNPHMIQVMLSALGEDPTRDGLVDTPTRWVKAMTELTSGYHQDPVEVLGTTFEVSYDEMVVVRDIPFASLCEHHLLPFHGKVSIGYIPVGRVLGLSKFARLVEVYSHRLQIQERLTAQIADTIQQVLTPGGTGVVVRAFHTCMAMRGVRREAEMVTSAMYGALRDKPEARAEFMALADGG